jgi:hypothetical protein
MMLQHRMGASMSNEYRIQVGLIGDDASLSKSPNEMRQEILRQSRDSAVIRNSLEMARHYGLSGEDMYVSMAFHALIMLEQYAQLDMRRTMMVTGRPTIINPDAPL